MSKGAIIAGEFIAKLATISEAERARAFDALLVVFPELARKLHNRERMRTKRAHEAHNRERISHNSEHEAHKTSTDANLRENEGVGGVSLSDLGSDLGSDPDLSGSPLSSASLLGSVPSPGAHVGTVDAVRNPLGPALFAYEAGVSRGRGERPFAVPRDQREDLLECVRVHGRDAQGPFLGKTLQDWLQADGEAFASWVGALPQAERERARWNYNPRAFLRWLNETAERVAQAEVHEEPERPSGTRATAPRRPQDAPEDGMAVFGGFVAKGGP